MTKEQLEKKLQFGLEKLDMRNCHLNYTGSKLKDIQKMKDPQWPKLIEIFAKSGLKTLDFGNCQIRQKGIDLIVWSIGQNPISPCSSLQILNLSKNSIT